MGERGFHHTQALVEREPGGSPVPGQHLVLLDRRVEAEPECGVAGHLPVSLPRPTDTEASAGAEAPLLLRPVGHQQMRRIWLRLRNYCVWPSGSRLPSTMSG
jgi:hypothetical protein